MKYILDDAGNPRLEPDTLTWARVVGAASVRTSARFRTTRFSWRCKRRRGGSGRRANRWFFHLGRRGGEDERLLSELDKLRNEGKVSPELYHAFRGEAAPDTAGSGGLGRQNLRRDDAEASGQE